MASETIPPAPTTGWSFSSNTTPARVVGAVSTSGSDESARLEFQFFHAGAKPAFFTTTRFAPGGEEKADLPLLSVTACSFDLWIPRHIAKPAPGRLILITDHRRARHGATLFVHDRAGVSQGRLGDSIGDKSNYQRKHNARFHDNINIHISGSTTFFHSFVRMGRVPMMNFATSASGI